jgi:hypothetical protein
MYSVQGVFQHHFQCKKCALYSIKYGYFKPFQVFNQRRQLDESSQLTGDVESFEPVGVRKIIRPQLCSQRVQSRS